jgi:hypothetical protein
MDKYFIDTRYTDEELIKFKEAWLAKFTRAPRVKAPASTPRAFQKDKTSVRQDNFNYELPGEKNKKDAPVYNPLDMIGHLVKEKEDKRQKIIDAADIASNFVSLAPITGAVGWMSAFKIAHLTRMVSRFLNSSDSVQYATLIQMREDYKLLVDMYRGTPQYDVELQNLNMKYKVPNELRNNPGEIINSATKIIIETWDKFSGPQKLVNWFMNPSEYDQKQRVDAFMQFVRTTDLTSFPMADAALVPLNYQVRTPAEQLEIDEYMRQRDRESLGYKHHPMIDLLRKGVDQTVARNFINKRLETFADYQRSIQSHLNKESKVLEGANGLNQINYNPSDITITIRHPDQAEYAKQIHDFHMPAIEKYEKDISNTIDEYNKQISEVKPSLEVSENNPPVIGEPIETGLVAYEDQKMETGTEEQPPLIPVENTTQVPTPEAPKKPREILIKAQEQEAPVIDEHTLTEEQIERNFNAHASVGQVDVQVNDMMYKEPFKPIVIESPKSLPESLSQEQFDKISNVLSTQPENDVLNNWIKNVQIGAPASNEFVSLFDFPEQQENSDTLSYNLKSYLNAATEKFRTKDGEAEFNIKDNMKLRRTVFYAQGLKSLFDLYSTFSDQFTPSIAGLGLIPFSDEIGYGMNELSKATNPRSALAYVMKGADLASRATNPKNVLTSGRDFIRDIAVGGVKSYMDMDKGLASQVGRPNLDVLGDALSFGKDVAVGGVKSYMDIDKTFLDNEKERIQAAKKFGDDSLTDLDKAINIINEFKIREALRSGAKKVYDINQFKDAPPMSDRIINSAYSLFKGKEPEAEKTSPKDSKPVSGAFYNALNFVKDKFKVYANDPIAQKFHNALAYMRNEDAPVDELIEKEKIPKPEEPELIKKEPGETEEELKTKLEESMAKTKEVIDKLEKQKNKKVDITKVLKTMPFTPNDIINRVTDSNIEKFLKDLRIRFDDNWDHQNLNRNHQPVFGKKPDSVTADEVASVLKHYVYLANGYYKKHIENKGFRHDMTKEEYLKDVDERMLRNKFKKPYYLSQLVKSAPVGLTEDDLKNPLFDKTFPFRHHPPHDVTRFRNLKEGSGVGCSYCGAKTDLQTHKDDPELTCSSCISKHDGMTKKRFTPKKFIPIEDSPHHTEQVKQIKQQKHHEEMLRKDNSEKRYFGDNKDHQYIRRANVGHIGGAYSKTRDIHRIATLMGVNEHAPEEMTPIGKMNLHSLITNHLEHNSDKRLKPINLLNLKHIEGVKQELERNPKFLNHYHV